MGLPLLLSVLYSLAVAAPCATPSVYESRYACATPLTY
ncbi:hypothetical protein M8PIadj_1292 [Bifidobacterium animalis]|nr:hypothetical protein M8PIadj_1292 [Bifidobacterium animalis]